MENLQWRTHKLLSDAIMMRDGAIDSHNIERLIADTHQLLESQQGLSKGHASNEAQPSWKEPPPLPPRLPPTQSTAFWRARSLLYAASSASNMVESQATQTSKMLHEPQMLDASSASCVAASQSNMAMQTAVERAVVSVQGVSTRQAESDDSDSVETAAEIYNPPLPGVRTLAKRTQLFAAQATSKLPLQLPLIGQPSEHGGTKHANTALGSAFNTGGISNVAFQTPSNDIGARRSIAASSAANVMRESGGKEARKPTTNKAGCRRSARGGTNDHVLQRNLVDEMDAAVQDA